MAETKKDNKTSKFERPSKEELERIVQRVRNRGHVNPMFSDVAEAFERSHPRWKTVWEYSPPDSKDQFEVQSRQMFGFRIVTVDEIPEGVPTPHTQESGPVRVSDLILMAAPTEIYEAYYDEMHKIALEDANAPEREAKEALKRMGRVHDQPGYAYGAVQTVSEDVDVDLSEMYEEKEE